jgi:hypothetical protein
MIESGHASSLHCGLFSELLFIVRVQAKAVIVFVRELRGNDFEEFRVIIRHATKTDTAWNASSLG